MAHAQLVLLASCACVPAVVRVLSVVTLTPLFPLTRISHSAFGVAGSTCLLGRQIANNLVAAILSASRCTTPVGVQRWSLQCSFKNSVRVTRRTYIEKLFYTLFRVLFLATCPLSLVKPTHKSTTCRYWHFRQSLILWY